jgi:hypothetical protein
MTRIVLVFTLVFVLHMLPGLLAAAYLLKPGSSGSSSSSGNSSGNSSGSFPGSFPGNSSGSFPGSSSGSNDFDNRLYALILAIAVNCLIGYAFFWVFFLDARIGRGLSLLLIVITAALPLISPVRKKLVALLSQPVVRTPLALMYVVALFYISILFMFKFDTEYVNYPNVRFIDFKAADNTLPLHLAVKLFNGLDPRGRNFMVEFNSSDRPPLQTGITLSLMKLTRWKPAQDLYYPAVATILQCLWVPVMWVLFRQSGASAAGAARMTIPLVFCGFFLFNTVYTWPKLFAGVLFMAAFMAVLNGFKNRLLTIAAPLLLALALLAHGGAAISLIVVVALCLHPRYFPGIRTAVMFALVLFVLMAPWSAYKSLYDPPGDRLAKIHLAGVDSIDDTRTFAQVLRDTYSQMTFKNWLAMKAKNIRFLGFRFDRYIDEPLYIRWVERDFPIRTLGLFNVGWLLLLLWPPGNRGGMQALSPGPNDEEIATNARFLLLVALLTIVVWALMLITPLLICHGSFAMMLMLFGGLSLTISRLPLRMRNAFLVLQTSYFLYAWVFFVPSGAIGVRYGAASLAAMTGAGLFVFGIAPEKFILRQELTPVLRGK